MLTAVLVHGDSRMIQRLNPDYTTTYIRIGPYGETRQTVFPEPSYHEELIDTGRYLWEQIRLVIFARRREAFVTLARLILEEKRLEASTS